MQVSLRPVEFADAEAVHEWASQPLASRFQAWGPNTWSQTEEFISTAVADWAAEPRIRWTFVALSAGQVVVIGEVHQRSVDVAEISYGVHTDHWDEGIGTGIARLLIDWIVEHLDVGRVLATCDPRNIASEKVLRHVGMTFVTTEPRTMELADGWRDSSVFALELAGGATASAPDPDLL